MLTHAKQARRNPCYSRDQDKEVTLNDITKIVTVLNLKILRLRDEVSDLKNASVVRNTNLIEETRSISRPKSNIIDTSLPCYESTTQEKSHNLTNCTCKKKMENNGSYKSMRMKNKKISREVQCNSAAEQKRKCSFLNFFRTDTLSKDHNKLKFNKRMKYSSQYDGTTFDPYAEKIDLFCKGGNLRKENYLDGRTVDFKLVEVESKERKTTLDQFKKLQEHTVYDNELRVREDEKNDKIANHSITRMGGGAECYRNRLISDFTDKVQKISLYKHVKLDAKKVKKRLDACIAELNEIIEDVSLIFPDTDILK